MQYFTRHEQIANGTEIHFSFPFSYMKQEDIHVIVGGVETEFTWIDSGTVEVSSPPAIGALVEIYRYVKKDERYVQFKDGSFLTEKDMNIDSTQHFMISQEAYDLAMKSLIDSASTTAIATDAKTLAEQAIVDSAEALGITSGMQAAILTATDSVNKANEAVQTAINLAEESTHGHTNKDSLDLINVDTTGSFALSINGIEQARANLGNVDMSAYAQTSGANIDVASYRHLLGVDAIEDNLTGISDSVTTTDNSVVDLNSRVGLLESKPEPIVGLAIAPQTIVKGTVGTAVFGCDPLAEHLSINGNDITINSGLQVCAGVDGSSVLSNELTSDSTLSMTSGSDGTHYIYADLDGNGDMSFGSTDTEPQIGKRRTGVLGSIINPQNGNWTGSGLSRTNGNWVAVSDTVYGGLGAFNASNGVTTGSDYWENGASMPTWMYLGNPVVAFAVKYVKIYAYCSSVNNPKNFIIQGSDDAQNWNNLLSVEEETRWVENEPLTFALPEIYTVKYIRIYITANTGSSYTLIKEVQLIGEGATPDLYNTSNHTHYDSDDNPIKRVYLGECEISGGSIVDIINYQHGTTVTIPVNGGVNIGINQKHYLDKPFLGYGNSQARIYHEGKWGKTGYVTRSDGTGVGTQSNYTDGVLSVQTGNISLTYSPASHCGGEFITSCTSAPTKVTVERCW